MKEITNYTDYRQLLKDYYETTRMENPWFSYQIFSQKAGIPSRGFLYNVVNGRRRLSASHVAGVAAAMKLSKSQFEYFENLVAFNNARSIIDKQRYFERMSSVNVTAKDGSHPHLVRKEQYRYYSQWYHAVVRSLIDLYGFRGDYDTLAQMVCPSITASQAKKSVALLESLGFIVKDDERGYRLVDKTITSAPEVISLAIHTYHVQATEIARRALNELPRERRNFTGVTLGISASAYSKVCREIEAFRSRLLDIAQNDMNEKEKQGVYQLNLQLFSVSQEPNGRSEP